MPSPFPGMDPYLEDPEIWRGVHHRLISAIDELIQPQLLPRGYFIDIESRIYLEEYERVISPDVRIARLPRAPDRPPGGGALVADPPTRVVRSQEEINEDFLSIREISSRRLVTGIEVISPSNKSDHKARRLYLKKRKELAAQRASLVEIDLLCGGRSLARLPKSVVQGAARDTYWANIIRVGSREYEFYAVPIRSPLPRVGIPLKTGEPDIVLDLGAALIRTHDAGAYDMQIDYARDPIPPLSADNVAWARALLAGRAEPGA